MPSATMPRRITVGPYTYTVDEHAPPGLLGQTDNDGLKLHIMPGQPHDAEAETLLHEVLHALLALTGYSRELGTKKEESLIRALSPVLLDTLRRNKRLVEYLLG